MKKIFITLGLMMAATLTLTNCSKTEDTIVDGIVSGEGVPFEIVVSTGGTKTSTSGLVTSWKADDAIGLYHAEAGSTDYVFDGQFTITEENLASNTFTGTLAEALDDAKSYDWYAYYPYSADLTTPANPNSVSAQSFNIGSSTQNGNNNTSHLCGAKYPLYARVTGVAATSGIALTMNQSVAVVKVHVTNSTAAPITVSDVALAANHNIGGRISLDFSGATPSYLNYSAIKTVSLDVAEASAIAAGESADFYLGAAPFTAAAGEKIAVLVNDFVKIIDISSDVVFEAGKIKTLNVSYTGPSAAVSTAAKVNVGFEASEGFVAATSYDNRVHRYYNLLSGMPWATIEGTPSTNSKISGSNSMQLRWYATYPDVVPYAFTAFRLSSVKSVAFSAKGQNSFGVKIMYSTDNGATWNLGQSYELTTTKQDIVYKAPSELNNVMFKFESVLPASLPETGNSYVIIDDVSFSAKGGDITQLYTCGFEAADGFTAATKYNTDKTDGPEGKTWTIHWGTASTNSKLAGSNSLQFRYYAATSGNYNATRPYAFMDFDVTGGVSDVQFKARRNGKTLYMNVYYSIDSGTSWTIVPSYTDFQPTNSSSQDYQKFSVSEENTKFRLKFEVSDSTPTPDADYAYLILDSIQILRED